MVGIVCVDGIIRGRECVRTVATVCCVQRYWRSHNYTGHCYAHTLWNLVQFKYFG